MLRKPTYLQQGSRSPAEDYTPSIFREMLFEFPIGGDLVRTRYKSLLDDQRCCRPSHSGRIAVYPSLSLLNQDLYCTCYSKFVDTRHH
jgi:hypothetical protein